MALTVEQRVKKLEKSMRCVKCKSLVYNTQTDTTYSLDSTDMGDVVTLDNASAVTLTIPSGLPDGFSVVVIQKGAGQVTFATSGTTLLNFSGHTKTAGQHAVVTLIQSDTAANTYYLAGDTAA